MSSFSRLTFLAVCLALLFNVSLGASVSWSVYNGTSCAGNSIYSNTDNSATTGSAVGINVVTSNCQQTSVFGSSVRSVQFQCNTGNLVNQQATFFSDTACTSANAIATGANQGSGCFPSVGQVQYSSTVSCTNKAFAMAALSLPLMALLALLATIMA